MSSAQDFNVRVEIKSEDIKTFSGVSSKTGNSFSIRSQDCWFYTHKEPYPLKFQITLRDTEEAYKKGFYQIAADSFFINRFNDLGFRVKLEPIGSNVKQ